MTTRLSLIEKDLNKILTNHWQPGAARMIYVKHTGAWIGKYKSWTGWMKHLIDATENTEVWLFRVLKAGEMLLELVKTDYDGKIDPPDLTKIESIEHTLKLFEKAKVATLYQASRLANKTGDKSIILQAALGEITASEIQELIKNHKASDLKKHKNAMSDSDEDEESEDQKSDVADSISGVVTFERLKQACNEFDLEVTTIYALLKRLNVVVKKNS